MTTTVTPLSGVSRVVLALTLVIAGAVGATIATTTPASATRTLSTVRYGGSYPDLGITYWASESTDDINVDVPAGNNRIVFTDPNASSMTITDDGSVTGTLCTLDDSTHISCPKFAYDSNPNLHKVYNVSVIGWDGADDLSATGAGMVIDHVTAGVGYDSTFTPIQTNLSGWEADDTVSSTGGFSFMTGGPGDDTLSSGPGKIAGAGSQFTDHLYGGAGNDTIDTVTNSTDADVVYCDDLVDVTPNPDTYLSDSLTKNTGDTVPNYFVPPSSTYPNGCDTITG